MKVIQVYGLGDTGILLTTGLNRLGVDTDLLVTNVDHAGHLPAWTNKYPELEDRVYVHRREDNMDPFTVIDFGRFVNKYDLAILHQPAGRSAYALKIPFHLWDGGSSRVYFPPKRLKNPPVEAEQAEARRSYKNARVVHASDIDMFYKLFHVPKRAKRWMFWRKNEPKYSNARYTPLPVDTDLFRPLDVEPFEDFTIYLPSRQESVKGTYQMLQGIRMFKYSNAIHESEREKFKIMMPQFGQDGVMLPHWLKEMGLTKHWLRVPLYSKPDFAKALNKCHVVVEQLLLGGYGGVAAQAMSCGKTVIVNAWRPWYEEQLGEYPEFLFAKTAFDVGAQLAHAYDFWKRDYWKMGERAREYIVRNHDYMKVAQRVKDSILNNRE